MERRARGEVAEAMGSEARAAHASGGSEPVGEARRRAKWSSAKSHAHASREGSLRARHTKHRGWEERRRRRPVLRAQSVARLGGAPGRASSSERARWTREHPNRVRGRERACGSAAGRLLPVGLRLAVGSHEFVARRARQRGGGRGCKAAQLVQLGTGRVRHSLVRANGLTRRSSSAESRLASPADDVECF